MEDFIEEIKKNRRIKNFISNTGEYPSILLRTNSEINSHRELIEEIISRVDPNCKKTQEYYFGAIVGIKAGFDFFQDFEFENSLKVRLKYLDKKI
jgi:hypothetical protein